MPRNDQISEVFFNADGSRKTDAEISAYIDARLATTDEDREKRLFDKAEAAMARKPSSNQ